jgi:hypothetical protein
MTAFLAVFVFSRLLVMYAVGLATGGREFTMDVGMHQGMAEAPLGPLLGQPYEEGQHPPLLGLMEAAFYCPLHRVFPVFYAMRLIYILWEAVGALFCVMTLRLASANGLHRLLGLLALLILPAGWMSSAVMAQDEVIAGAVLAAALWFFFSGRAGLSAFLCGMGVAGGKVFLLLPLAAFVVFSGGLRGSLRTAAFGAGPVVFFYGWAAVAAAVTGASLPLVGFTPPNVFGTSVWTLAGGVFGFGLEFMRRASVGLSALVLAAVFIYVYRRNGTQRLSATAMAALSGVLLIWFFNLFYHVNPEYYALLVPAAVLLVGSWKKLLMLLAVYSAPWAVNFFYGVAGALSEGGGGSKGAFVALYEALFSSPPGSMLTIALAVNAVLFLAYAVLETRGLARGLKTG